MSQYNLRNPAVKRLMREAEELKCPTKEYHAQPLDDNLFEWHFTLSGPPNTEFEGGVYHGRITLPPDYPMKPPSIILLTPNGRFETNKKICLSISGYHPESWQPSWSIRTALVALIGFLPTHGNGAIGSLDYTPEERKDLALKSQKWKCPQCGLVKKCLIDEVPLAASPAMIFQSLNQIENRKCDSSDNRKNASTEAKERRVTFSKLPSNVQGDGHASASNYPISRSEECIMRHRQQISKYKATQRMASLEASNCSFWSKWSSFVIWLIVISLSFLIFRRMTCQQ